MSSPFSTSQPSGVYQAHDPAHLKLIRDQQEATLESNRERGQKFCKLKEDYIKLKETISKLPEQTSMPAMVPLGKKAFMPGRIVHTNEILVLLGDNWFAERSAKQATEIIDRRLARCDDMLEKLLQEKRLVEGWRRETSQLEESAGRGEGNLEIREEFDEEEEARWRDRHAERVREEKRKGKGKDGKEQKEEEEDEALWRRLDELELEEELEEHLRRQEEEEEGDESEGEEKDNGEEKEREEEEFDEEEEGSEDWSESPELTDEEESEGDEDNAGRPPSLQGRRVSFAGLEGPTSSEAPPRIKKREEARPLRSPPTATIEFSHSPASAVSSSGDLDLDPSLLGPSDLESRFAAVASSSSCSSGDQGRSKSILKPFDPSDIRVRAGAGETTEETTVVGRIPQVREPAVNPVGDVVMERRETVASVAPPLLPGLSDGGQPAQKRVSKFKQSRMK